MARSFKVYAALLSYPTKEICEAAPVFKEVLDTENLLPARDRVRVATLIDQLASRDLYDLQERYVELFDRSRTLSLHLFEHVHGEGRDRGQAMVDLKQHYESHGLEMASSELPDFLPLLLEFLSERPLDEARAFLGETVHVLDALTERLHHRKSIYTAVMRNLARIADRSAELTGVAVQTPDEESGTLEAMDREWAEEQVTFGPDPSAGCPVSDNMLKNMAIPPHASGSEGGRP